jgi:hypothetical protein
MKYTIELKSFTSVFWETFELGLNYYARTRVTRGIR